MKIYTSDIKLDASCNMSCQDDITRFLGKKGIVLPDNGLDTLLLFIVKNLSLKKSKGGKLA